MLKKQKLLFVLTTDLLKDDLPKTCKPIIVENVLVSTSKITSKFYPESINDDFDETVKYIEKTNFKDKVKLWKKCFNWKKC